MGAKKKGDSKKKETNPEALILKLREEINKTDSAILRLLNKRAKAARKIGELKEKSHTGFYVPAREEEIIERLAQENPGPFPTDSIAPVFREIISACRGLEKKLKVAYLGPEATFTHLAAVQKFGQNAEFKPEPSIADIFDVVERGHADYGVVPIENSTEGVVTHTLDMFLGSELIICAEVVLEIAHHLLSRSGELKKIKRIYSHPQAVAQCRNWLRKNLPGVEIKETASTAEAARLAAADPHAAAIAGEFAGKLYGLKTAASRIEDLARNYTRFLVIGREQAKRSGRDLTAVVFSVKDRPGVLYEALGHFARRGINLAKIESRPLKGRAWEYVFFVEMDGHVEDPDIKAALADLEKDCLFVKVLGSFRKMRRRRHYLGI